MKIKSQKLHLLRFLLQVGPESQSVLSGCNNQLALFTFWHKRIDLGFKIDFSVYNICGKAGFFYYPEAHVHLFFSPQTSA